MLDQFYTTVAKALITMREAGVIDEYLPAAAFLELATETSPIAEAALLIR